MEPSISTRILYFYALCGSLGSTSDLVHLISIILATIMSIDDIFKGFRIHPDLGICYLRINGLPDPFFAASISSRPARSVTRQL